MKRVLMVYPRNLVPSGGSVVNAWMMSALNDAFALTTLAWDPAELAELDRCHGTALHGSRVQVRTISRLARQLYRLDRDPWRFQARCYLFRKCQNIAREYDAVIAADNECDFGRRGIQYIHYPSLYHLSAKRPPKDASWKEKAVALLTGRYRPWMLVSRYSFPRMRRNLTLVNSDWTGRWFNRIYGVETTTVYPPVLDDFPQVPWEQKKVAFVCIGRFAATKRLELAVRVIEKVRESFPEVELHLVGARQPAQEDQGLAERLTQQASTRPWLHLHMDPTREQLVRIVAGQRYAIHAAEAEHFGIGPAEALLAGNIVFVRNDGGQVEIVGQHGDLIYSDVDDGAAKICQVLGNSTRQETLRAFLHGRRNLFTIEAFASALRKNVERFIEVESGERVAAAVPAAAQVRATA